MRSKPGNPDKRGWAGVGKERQRRHLLFAFCSPTITDRPDPVKRRVPTNSGFKLTQHTFAHILC